MSMNSVTLWIGVIVKFDLEYQWNGPTEFWQNVWKNHTLSLTGYG